MRPKPNREEHLLRTMKVCCDFFDLCTDKGEKCYQSCFHNRVGSYYTKVETVEEVIEGEIVNEDRN